MFKRYCYLIEVEYDTPEFRRELNQIALDNSSRVASLKDDATTSVWRSAYQSQPLLIKRYNTRSVWHAIRRAFRQSRAENCQIMTRVLAQAGICTAPNIATIQEWLGPFKLRSWFICEYISGELLIQYFTKHSENTLNDADLDSLKCNISNLFNSLRDHQISHGDLKASNILLSNDQLYLIDLDAARAHKNTKTFLRAHKKDQIRFMNNWLNQSRVYKLFEASII